ncbi:MAG: hypothetical protein AAGH53_09835 [Pseudomonadota bacterium]
MRISPAILFSAALSVVAAACSGPIMTRIEGQSAAQLPSRGQYILADVPDVDLPLLDQAQRYAVTDLAEHGWELSQDSADYQLVVTLSERPAAIGLKVKQEDNLRLIAEPKEEKPLQSCEDVEHRVTVTLLSRTDGSKAYSGSAAEFHCKAELAETMAILVNAALEDFGQSGSKRVVQREGKE